MLTHDPSDRLAVARRTYAIVCAFAEPGTPDDVIADRLSGWTAAEVETAVRVLSMQAEMNSRAWNGRNDQIVMAALDAESLADDYMRIKSGHQWMAFDDAEQDDPSLRPSARDHCPATEHHFHDWTKNAGPLVCTACGATFDGAEYTPGETSEVAAR